MSDQCSGVLKGQQLLPEKSSLCANNWRGHTMLPVLGRGMGVGGPWLSSHAKTVCYTLLQFILNH